MSMIIMVPSAILELAQDSSDFCEHIHRFSKTSASYDGVCVYSLALHADLPTPSSALILQDTTLRPEACFVAFTS